MKKMLLAGVLLAGMAVVIGVWVVSHADGSPPGTVGGAWEAIHHAADDGDVEKVRQLLDQGEDVNRRTKHGWTPLHLAAKKNRLDVAALLIDRGADLNIVGWGATPLQDAAFQNHGAMGELLRERGATVDASSAAGFGWMDELVVLLDQQPDLLEPCPDERRGRVCCPCLLHAAARGGQAEAVRLLLDRGAPVNVPDERGRTSLHFAAEHNRPEVITLLVQAGHEVDVSGRGVVPPLYGAAGKGHVAAVRALLEHGADPAKLTASGTAMDIARRRGHAEVVQVLEAWANQSQP